MTTSEHYAITRTENGYILRAGVTGLKVAKSLDELCDLLRKAELDLAERIRSWGGDGA